MRKMKINIAAVLLAVMMMCLMPFKIYAAEAPTIDSAFSNVTSYFNDIQLSNYYIHHVLNDSDSYVFFTSDFSEKYKNFCIVYESDVNHLVMYKYDNSILDNCVTNDKVRYGVVYNSTDFCFKCHVSGDLSWYGILFDISSFSSLGFPDCFTSFDTNIPLFDSKDSAQAYYETGDTSGLLNGDNFQTYDKSIETPRDMRVDMDADFRAQMGYAPANAPDDSNASNSTCVFTWSQSEEVVEAGDYETEIYYQTTFVHHSNMFAIGKKTFSLSSSVLVASVPVTRTGMTYTMDFKQITKIYEEWQDSGLIGGTLKPTYPTEPYYFYIRNKVGNNYGNWVRVTVTNDNITTSNTITGASTVTGGYDEIDGSSATLPGVNQKLDGDTVADSQYGKKYSVDIDSADLDSVVGKLRKGFGILGDNGLIALLNGFFSFIPDEYFSVLITFVSGACILGVLFLVLRR